LSPATGWNRTRLAAGLLAVAALVGAGLLHRARIDAIGGPGPEDAALAIEREADALLFERDEPARAAEAYARAAALLPAFPALHKRAWALLAAGDTPGAVAGFEEAMAAAPPALDAERYAEGVAALRAGQHELGRAALARAYLDSRPEALEGLR
jgi:tetratricopeptide (TPR) repeat protein